MGNADQAKSIRSDPHVEKDVLLPRSRKKSKSVENTRQSRVAALVFKRRTHLGGVKAQLASWFLERIF